MAATNPVDVHVGKRLRFGRTMQGLSQESIGESIGVTFQQIQKYERGINCIRSSKLFELANVLKVPITFFFEGIEHSGEKYSIPGAADSATGFDMELTSSRESVELMRAFHKISDPQLRSKILDLVRAMSDNKVMY
ncbi:MAG: helix-turn-helix domain-containing protein [Alphaproteobacteria bacterium]|nr:helix-turn-helix domain-containing protein [Alphaproteobacteria bacterium]